MIDLLAQIFIGGGSVLACVLLLIHCDEFADGNVGGADD